MEIRIAFLDEVTPEDSFALDELAEDLFRSDIGHEVEKSATRHGRKDGGLSLAIAIGGLAISAIGTLISALTFWQKSRPAYKLNITRGPVTFAIENPTPEQIRTVTSRLQDVEDEDAEIAVQIQRR